MPFSPELDFLILAVEFGRRLGGATKRREAGLVFGLDAHSK